MNITKRQKEVLDLINKEMLTQKQISRRLNISEARVSQHIKKLKTAGLTQGLKGLRNGTRVPPQVPPLKLTPNEHPLRLHGEQYRVVLLRSGSKYHQVRGRCSSLWVDGNRVVFYRDVLVLFVARSFYGVDPDSCELEAGEYLFRVLTMLESRYDLTLLKARSENIKRVKAHFAECNNELSDEMRRLGEKCRIFGSLDGKEWLLFDDSSPDGLGLSEAETTHSPTKKDFRSSRDDMVEVVQPFFNDLRDNRPSLPSLLERSNKVVLESSEITARQLLAVASSLNTMSSLLELHLKKNYEPSFPVEKQDYIG